METFIITIYYERDGYSHSIEDQIIESPKVVSLLIEHYLVNGSTVYGIDSDEITTVSATRSHKK